MPIKRVKLEIWELMYEQESYDILLEDHKERFVNFDMRKFEAYNIERNRNRMIELDLISYIKDKLNKLDIDKPLYSFSEEGTHYAFELFLAEPKIYKTKGDLFFWTYMARQFSNDVLPMAEEDFKNKYLNIVNKFNIPFGKDEVAYIDEFSCPSVCKGDVNGIFVKEALDMLIERLKLNHLLKVAGNAEHI